MKKSKMRQERRKRATFGGEQSNHEWLRVRKAHGAEKITDYKGGYFKVKPINVHFHSRWYMNRQDGKKTRSKHGGEWGGGKAETRNYDQQKQGGNDNAIFSATNQETGTKIVRIGSEDGRKDSNQVSQACFWDGSRLGRVIEKSWGRGGVWGGRKNE